MTEYIDRNALIEHMKKDPLFDLVEQYGITGVIESFPVADVQPVKHGRWIDKNPQDKYDPRCICSVCGSVEFPLSRHKYCPNCGAKMDGGDA